MRSEILSNGGRLFYFPKTSMRYSFEGLMALVPRARVYDVIVVDSTNLERKKILRLCPQGKIAILYRKTTPREKFMPLSD